MCRCFIFPAICASLYQRDVFFNKNIHIPCCLELGWQCLKPAVQRSIWEFPNLQLRWDHMLVLSLPMASPMVALRWSAFTAHLYYISILHLKIINSNFVKFQACTPGRTHFRLVRPGVHGFWKCANFRKPWKITYFRKQLFSLRNMIWGLDEVRWSGLEE